MKTFNFSGIQCALIHNIEECEACKKCGDYHDLRMEMANYVERLEKALDEACRECEALDEGLAYEISSDNFEVEDWESRKKRFLEESEKE